MGFYLVAKDGTKFEVDRKDYLALRHLPIHRSGFQNRYGRLTLPNGEQVLLHRFLLGAVKGLLVDHKDGNTLNNRRDNLRVCTKRQNTRNSPLRRNNTSGYIGVSFHSSRWRATITFNGKRLYLGHYPSKEEAALVYDQAAQKLFGAFASLNFPQYRGLR